MSPDRASPQGPQDSPVPGVEDPGAVLRPAVAGPARGGGLALMVGVATLLGFGAFAALSSHRMGDGQGARSAGPRAPAPISAAPPPDLGALEGAARAARFPPPPPVVSTPDIPPSLVLGTPALRSPDPASPSPERRRAPALVVDYSAPAAAAAPPPLVAANGAKAAAATLNSDEQFAERVGAGETDRARATMMSNPGSVVPQGATIPAVLETALNSDLPGFARAVVSRDVRSFDGARVLIPRGSRVIGQYRSAVAQGQSRAFVIWTRLQRPDGAAIQIASSGTDPLGRAGLEGQVDRHFFQQFGGAILLSVINGAAASLSDRPNTQIVIGSAQDATNLGANAVKPTNLSPTIKVAQGAPVRIFVARDLDFSAVADPVR